MSAQGSPQMVPQPDPTGSTSRVEAQLVLRMITAAESAAGAARAAASRPSGSKDDWYKMLPKPSQFDPKDRDAELSQFRDWWWNVEQYLTAVDSEYLQHFDIARKNLDTPIVMSTLTDEQQREVHSCMACCQDCYVIDL